MRLLPWEYGVRNLLRRPLRTGLTAFALTMVVFLLLLVMGFLRGLDTSLQQSGDEDVLMVHQLTAEDNLENSSIYDSVPAEIRSDRLSSHLVSHAGTLAMSPELVIATTVGMPAEHGQSQLGVFRGVQPEIFLVRRKAYLVDGTLPKSGEILAGRLVAAKIGAKQQDLAIGKELVVEGKPWKISGHFAAPGTLLEAEIWAPLDELKQHMKRPNDISLIALRVSSNANRAELERDIKLFNFRNQVEEVTISPEVEYYASLQRHFEPMRALAWLLVVLVASAGACSAMNTMYAAVAGRVREFAALQAIGFRRRAISISLVQESVLLAAFSTLAATGLALVLIQGVAIRFTMGAFALQLDRPALLIGCGSGLLLGVVGAIPPAIRAFRLPIVDALKAV